MKSIINNLGILTLGKDCQGAIMTLYPNTLAFQQKAASCCQSLKSVLGYQQGVAFYLTRYPNMTMRYFWHNNSTPVKIFAILTAGAAAYLFFIDGESFWGWIVFFITLTLMILLNTIDEGDKEIQELRSQREHGNEERAEPQPHRDPRSYDPFYGSSAVFSQEQKAKILNKFRREEPEVKTKSKDWQDRMQEINEQARKEGRLLTEPLLKEDEMQVLFFRKNPKYPNQKSDETKQ